MTNRSSLPNLITCHVLIGVPGSGKSTFAQEWVEAELAYCIVSTDRIREELFGDENLQGNWPLVEARVLDTIRVNLAQGKSVIYDATNAKRPWRMNFLHQVREFLATHPDDPHPAPIQWMAWHLDTPISTCQWRNRQRQRTVPNAVIEDMAAALKRFPPEVAEGFAAVNRVPTDPDGRYNLPGVFRKIRGLGRSLTSRANRSRQVDWHPYSLLLDFDRLMFLMASILRHPGLGNLGVDRASVLFGTGQGYETALAEIGAAMAKEYGTLYADGEAIARDLAWLEDNGFLNHKVGTSITIDTIHRPPNTETHRYSDRYCFLRLMAIVRAIIRSPLQWQPGESIQETLLQQLQGEEEFAEETRDNLRRDIELGLKPYGLLHSDSHRRGYFVGTAILTPGELNRVYRLLQSQAKHFDDPLVLETYQTLDDRLRQSRLLEVDEVYPVRAMGTRPIVNTADLPPSVLACQIEQVERAIEGGELLELKRLRGGGRFAGDPEAFFLAWPVQLVFHNIAWYLGFECCGGNEDGLLCFGRLDRLFLGRSTQQTRSRQQQQQALKRLNRLYDASAGVFLGNSAEAQRLYLSGDRFQRQQVEVTVELWCNDRSFRFISEGTQRFRPQQMQMSPKPEGGVRGLAKSLFTLKPTSDPQFPHRFRVRLPQWSLKDVDLKRWILGWGGEVKVVRPPELVALVREVGEAIVGVYEP